MIIQNTSPIILNMKRKFSINIFDKISIILYIYNSLNFRISLLSIIFIDLLFPESIPRKQTHRNSLIKVFLNVH